MKSVRMRILTTISLLVAIAMLLVGGASIILNNWTTNGVLEETMLETAKVAADRVSNQLRAYRIIAQTAGHDQTLTNPDISVEEKQAFIDSICAQYPDIVRGNVLDLNGISIFSGQDFSDRAYFKQSIQGEAAISDPLISKTTGEITIVISAPIYDVNEIAGVVYFIPTETFLDDIVKSIKVSAGGGAVILNKEGTVIAHPNKDFVANLHNSIAMAKSDSSYKAVAGLESEMLLGKSGFGTYEMKGVNKFMAYAPVPDTDGWSMNVNAPTNDFMSYTNASILITCILLAVALIAAAIIAIIISNSIGKPLKFLSRELGVIASTGRLELDPETRATSELHMAKKDEIGEIARAVNNLIDMLSESSSNLGAISDGDLSVNIATRSSEDTLGNAMSKMVNNLNDMFSEIQASTSHVATGSKQIADGAQALAQGSTQQAAAVQQLSSSISEIADQTKGNADMAARAADLGNTIKGNAEKGSRQMDQMMQAVKEINEASQSINKVIKAIDDIAFQTNILALNAAVEAARAGQHGKGFAVVAEEVRNLAAKSSEAAKETGSLIANSIEKAELGASIANETAASLSEIVTGINQSTELVGDIAKSSEEQSAAITQINKGIDQVAQVVQQNSATSEQSAAASQEMSGQSDVLQELISQFRLKGGATLIGGSSRAKKRAPVSDYNVSDMNNGGFGKY